jgi:uncharacterized protein YndB with AHSA1/START domain
MTTITNTVLIDRKPEEVFDYCVDLRNELEWNHDARSMEKLTEGPPGVGTRFLAKWKTAPRPIEVRCTTFDRPTTWTFVNGGPVTVTFTGRVRPEADATRLDVTFEAEPHGWFRLVFPVFVRVMKRQERANMANLKRALEARP